MEYLLFPGFFMPSLVFSSLSRASPPFSPVPVIFFAAFFYYLFSCHPFFFPRFSYFCSRLLSSPAPRPFYHHHRLTNTRSEAGTGPSRSKHLWTSSL